MNWANTQYNPRAIIQELPVDTTAIPVQQCSAAWYGRKSVVDGQAQDFYKSGNPNAPDMKRHRPLEPATSGTEPEVDREAQARKKKAMMEV